MSEEVPPETPDETNEEGESLDLGDAGKRAIAAERKRADALEKELKAFKLDAATRANAELSELERLKKERDELFSSQSAKELEAIRYKVALEKGLPANLAARIQGSDYDEMSADAEALAEMLPSGTKPSVPRADPSQGQKPTGNSQTPAEQFADIIRNQTRG